MNKLSKIFAGFAALALCASCSNDDIIDNGGEQPVNPNVPVGDTAYMRINISDVNGNQPHNVKGSRAGDDFMNAGYKDGSYDEHAVSNAQFFFFDENGVFVQKGSLQNPEFGEDHQTPGPVEYIGKNNILVLEGLTGTSWPRFLLTVLNAPNFEPESTLALTAEKLDHYIHELTINGEEKNCFVMSTSSFHSTDGDDFNVSNHNNAYPYATQLQTSDFYLSSEEALQAANSVKIYVERLAAKVQVNVSDELTYIEKNGKKLYKLSQTVAGSNNDEGNDDDKATTEIYLQVEGWDLSGVISTSHMSKIFGDWNNTTWNTAWNDENNYRSYWGKSAVYGEDVTNVTDAYANYLVDINGTLAPTGAWYANFNSKIDLGKAAYCNENTNIPAMTVEKLNDGTYEPVTSRLTHVQLKTIVCDGEGNPLDMVKYHGVLYLQKAYINYVLNTIMNGDASNLNYYTKGADNKYHQVDATFFEVKGIGNQKVEVAVADASKALILYSYDKATDTWSDGTTSAALLADLEARLAAQQTGFNAEGYKGGMSVYYIPIKHDQSLAINAEGYYGVVRNHWYNLTINSFSKVGHGVFDPEEELIPDGPEDPLYYLSVNINVLSWKLVNQGVDL